MKKILNIAWKDLTLVLRDPPALLMMLATPFALTLVIGFAFGGIGGQASTLLRDIPVVIVNHDTGQLGENLVSVFQSDELADLVEPVFLEDDAAARASVDADESAAAVIIPAGFTNRMIPIDRSSGQFEANQEAEPVSVEVYANPTRRISVGVVQGIVNEFLNRVNAAGAGGQVAIVGLLQHGLVSPQEMQALGPEIGERAGEQTFETYLIALRTEAASGDSGGEFDWLAFMAPSMAILFLMFTTTAGARTILAERDGGTLPRMLVSPSTTAEVLGGKVLGVFLNGVLQLGVLAVGSRLLLGLSWGHPLGVVLLILALVFAATGWGILLAAYSRTPSQVNNVGTALALVFGIGSGNFMPRMLLPEWLKTASLVTPNFWGLEGFTSLLDGAGWQAVLQPAAVLFGMGVVLFVVALFAFRRQYA